MNYEIKNPEFYPSTLNSITPVPSQSINVTYNACSFLIYLDSGATVSFITLKTAQKLKLKITPNGQLALLADEKTRMHSLGEVDVLVYLHGQILLRLRALVVKHLQVECYGGTTFHNDNGIVPDISTGMISFHGGQFEFKQHNPIPGGRPIPHPPPTLSTKMELPNTINGAAVQPYSDKMLELADQISQLRTEIRAAIPSQTVTREENVKEPTSTKDVPMMCSTMHVMTRRAVLPGDVYELQLNTAQVQPAKIAVVPQFSRSNDLGTEWQPQICSVNGGQAAYRNTSGQLLTHHKGAHFGMIPVTQMTYKKAMAGDKNMARDFVRDLTVT